MAITWNESLLVNIPEIDNQHREFIRLLMKLDKAIEEGKITEHLGNVLSELNEYVKYHFDTEEHHFDEFGCYPNAEAHRDAHHAFTERLQLLKARFADDPNTLSAEVAQTMYDWLVTHIAKMDREYIDCFKSSGL